MKKILFFLFGLLFFLVPLILLPWTSEIFEFNKMVLVYLLTSLIACVWLIESIIAKKIIFRRTILDIPLLFFIGSQIISTILSIDPRTSFYGYYSRFSGGLLSTICYSLLYWAYVSNFDFEKTKKLIFALLTSAVLVSSIGVFEHFGVFPTCLSINNYQIQHDSKTKTDYSKLNFSGKINFLFSKCWEQDTQNRVFSTFGQPNWLAAWLVAIIPLTWMIAISNFQFPISKQIRNSKFQIKSIVPYFLSALFFITLLFTKSRSGLLGFIAADLIYWGFILIKFKKEYLKPFIICHLSFAFFALVIGTQFTPSILPTGPARIVTQSVAGGPALEVGGTESGTIRRIVWKGAIEVWKHYPIFGTGVETFAFAYPKYSPVEHNLVSEWDFIYNKAHNEYLNYAANSGSVGLLSYLVLIIFSVIQITNYQLPITNKLLNLKIDNSSKNENWEMKIALLAGFASLLVTNFFGFSVIPTQILLFLFPAIAITITTNKKVEFVGKKTLNNGQKVTIFLLLLFTIYLLFLISRYWYADYIFQKAMFFENSSTALTSYKKAIEIEPNEAKYHNSLAGHYTNLALSTYQQKDAEKTSEFIDLALSESQKAIDLSPSNINYKKTRFGIYVKLSTIKVTYLTLARDLLISIIEDAPTDAKVYYSLGTTYARIGQIDLSLATLKKTIELKANYKEARLAYALVLINQKRIPEAKIQLEYILKNIDPTDSLTRQTLESIK
ncbi:MAG TPA: O-antigen ligase family protein [Patescibacteria group bacterium]|nr:O-antigen ligase family protein [Patescibacteria group bacterium]